MMIKNFKDLAITSERENFLKAFDFAIENSRPEKILKSKVKLKGNILKIKNKNFDLSKFRDIYILGIGKASYLSCKFLTKLLKNKIKKGFCIDTKIEEKLEKIYSEKGTHPLPSKINYNFTKEVVKNLSNLNKYDLVIAVISGGGSALFCYPYKQECIIGEKIFKLLTKYGANIEELNTVRKHFSLVKGGNLAKIIFPATIISLIFSDVPGDNLSFIASGPTVKDSTTIKDVKQILKKYEINININFFETPKENKYFKNVYNFLIGSNKDFIKYLKEFLEKKDYKIEIFKYDFQMEAKKAGKFLLEKTKKGKVMLTGGETFVKVKGKGRGGRNLEVCLGALKELKNDELIISFATDGWDNTDSAGAISDKLTLQKYKKLNLDILKYLKNNDSYNFFKKTKDLIFTGKTGINFSDIILTYRYR